jgi:TIR domain
MEMETPPFEEDAPEGKDYDRFGGLHYKQGRRLDGIPRTPYVLTTEHTHRLVHGSPEIYVTCLYRWNDSPVARYLSTKATEFGKRLGKNKFLLPAPGCEEAFWHDAAEILDSTDLSTQIAFEPTGVYFLISGVNPQLLSDSRYPFILCDLSLLGPGEVTALFSKVLDLFHVGHGSVPHETQDGMSPGQLLLSAQDVRSSPVTSALRLVAEISVVLQNLRIGFYRFPLPIIEEFQNLTTQLHADESLHGRLDHIRALLSRLQLPQVPEDPASHTSRPLKARVDQERDIFICHRSVDKATVRPLAQALVAHGVTVWFDEAEIGWGESVIDKMSRGVLNARFVVVCIGPTFRTGNFAKYELELAMQDEIRFGINKVLPLLLTDSDAATDAVLDQVPSVRAKSYRTLASGVETIVSELVSICSKGGAR